MLFFDIQNNGFAKYIIFYRVCSFFDIATPNMMAKGNKSVSKI